MAWLLQNSGSAPADDLEIEHWLKEGFFGLSCVQVQNISTFTLWRTRRFPVFLLRRRHFGHADLDLALLLDELCPGSSDNSHGCDAGVSTFATLLVSELVLVLGGENQ